MVVKDSPCLEAHRLVTGPRREAYGDIDEGFQAIADMWNIMLSQKFNTVDRPITTQDVCRMMICLKLSRDILVEKPDNLTDICGYVELAHMMRTKDVSSK